jgi:micrococcal nuclease
VDGDTIDVVIDGVEERVRYIGIDSPERGACYENEATAANASLVDGKTVALEPDVENGRDSFGRLLRYVHVDGLFVNEALVEGGFAEATTRFPERAYRDVLLAAEAEAKADGRGL